MQAVAVFKGDCLVLGLWFEGSNSVVKLLGGWVQSGWCRQSGTCGCPVDEGCCCQVAWHEVWQHLVLGERDKLIGKQNTGSLGDFVLFAGLALCLTRLCLPLPLHGGLPFRRVRQFCSQRTNLAPRRV